MPAPVPSSPASVASAPPASSSELQALLSLSRARTHRSLSVLTFPLLFYSSYALPFVGPPPPLSRVSYRTVPIARPPRRQPDRLMSTFGVNVELGGAMTCISFHPMNGMGGSDPVSGERAGVQERAGRVGA